MTNYVNSVQQVSITIASGSTTGTASVTAATGTFFICYRGSTTSATTSMAQGLARLSIAGTTITATRNTSSTNTVTVNCAVVDADSANLIKTVQFGNINITTGTSSTATISSVTTTNTVVVYIGHSSGLAAFDYSINTPRLSLTSATVVTSTVGASSTSSNCAFCVVEFQGTALNQNTQFVSKTWTTSTLTTTQAVTSVNVNNAMVVFAGGENHNTLTFASDQQWVQLTGATTLTYHAGATNGDATTTNVWVIEFVAGVLSQNAQRGSIAMAAAASNTATITSATSANTLVQWVGFTTPTQSAANLGLVMPRLTQTNATTLTANLNASGSATIGYEALTFTAGGGGASNIFGMTTLDGLSTSGPTQFSRVA